MVAIMSCSLLSYGSYSPLLVIFDLAQKTNLEASALSATSIISLLHKKRLNIEMKGISASQFEVFNIFPSFLRFQSKYPKNPNICLEYKNLRKRFSIFSDKISKTDFESLNPNIRQHRQLVQTPKKCLKASRKRITRIENDNNSMKQVQETIWPLRGYHLLA